jgi:benzil reductase ((S)-benzoin forming)
MWHDQTTAPKCTVSPGILLIEKKAEGVNVYYITGTSRGLGKALATELLNDNGNRVFGIGRSCTLNHARYQHYYLDLSVTEKVREFRFQLPRGTQRAVLVNNAGVIAPVAPVGRIDNQTLAAGFTVNLISPAMLMNNFIRHTQNNRSQRLIVNISSGAARHTVDSWAVYCAAKAGLDMFSQVLHSEQPIHLPKRPVRIFSIAPGVVDTGMQAQIRATSKEDFPNKERFVKMKADGVLVPANETARSILKILARPEAYAHVCLDVRDLK